VGVEELDGSDIRIAFSEAVNALLVLQARWDIRLRGGVAEGLVL
jgi:hypothetical protein